MSYTALYRKWRPLTFEDVKGQDPIVRTLKNQVETGRLGHAYLFCGTRGTGKTTIAKILARAVNCEHPQGGSPCNECPSCRAILAGAAMHVVEIDAASNNGVDNIRQIIEEVQYPPADGRFRVYIIDEVHMLSAGAFNALLKTLEEPPAYVIFILATTEPHKIPVTVLSRCQRYDFRRISQETIAARLKEMTDAEGMDAEEDALRLIARRGDGSMRDAISLLDQCAAFYYGKTLTHDGVLDVLGAADQEVFHRLLHACSEGDAASAVRVVDGAVSEGRELSQFTSDMIWYLRSLLLIRGAGGDEELLDVSQEDLAQLRTMAGLVPEESLIRQIRILSETLNSMRYASNKRVLLEVAVLKICRPQTETDLTSLTERIRQLEKRIEEGRFTEGPAAPAAAPEEKKAAPVVKKLTPAQMSDYKEIEENWDRILDGLSSLSYRIGLLDVRREPVGDGIIDLVFPTEGAMMTGGRERVLQDLSARTADVIGKLVTYRARTRKSGESEDVRYIVSDEELSQAFHMEIEHEDGE